MKAIIISGLAGAEKTPILQSLEDKGAYCIDNLPLIFLTTLATIQIKTEPLSLGIDDRRYRDLS